MKTKRQITEEWIKKFKEELKEKESSPSEEKPEWIKKLEIDSLKSMIETLEEELRNLPT